MSRDPEELQRCYAWASPARAPFIHSARIVLLNPNTTVALTDLTVEIAREVAAAGLSVEGLTAPFGPPLITRDLQLEEAARAVLSLAPVLAQRADAVIVAAFGDPRADALANMLAKPVIGIAEPPCGSRPAGDGASWS